MSGNKIFGTYAPALSPRVIKKHMCPKVYAKKRHDILNGNAL